MSNRRVRNNEKSQLLSDQENETIFNILGKGCQSLSTAVVQLYLSVGDENPKWAKEGCRVVCFEKDNPKRSYFIRVYDPMNHQMIWEQEIYMHFKYNTPKDFFHTFEAESSQAGLNFVSEDEADKFQQVVQGKLSDMERKRKEKNKHESRKGVRLAECTALDTSGSAPTITVGETPLYKTVGNTVHVRDTTNVENKRKEKSKKKITKRDIGYPTQFRHVAHAGWDQEKMFKTEKLDSDMKALCEELGLFGRSQVDEDTIDFIYEFAEQHGGVRAVREDIARRNPPAAPLSSTDQGHAHIDKGTYPLASHKFAAPDPSDRNQTRSSTHRPVQLPVVPPLIPNRNTQNISGIESSIPQSPSIPDAPPLPPSAPSNAPPPSSFGMGACISSPSPSSGRAGLLDAIHNFNSSTLSNVRSKKNVRKHVTSSVDPPGGIAAALMDALNKRKNAIQSSDDEDRSSDDMDDEDGDEWDD